jgi:tetratricopeptide (TPR) repeat protein
LHEDPSAEIRTGRPALRDAYEEWLSRCGADNNNDTQIVLSVLAAAGAGPALPLKLLLAASGKLGGPATEAGVRDELFRLRGLVVRGSAGTEREHAGLFHDTLVGHIADYSAPAVLAAHRALTYCIQLLAPPDTSQAGMRDPIQRYAFEREAEHLWALGDTDGTLRCLNERKAAAPRDNLRRLISWGPRIENHLGADHPVTLQTRGYIARYTGEYGEGREALRLYEALLPDQARALGADHPDTLRTRGNIAYVTGECGKVREALRLSEALLPDMERVLGADHPATLATRQIIARFTGECGEAREALRLFETLLPDQARVLGADHPNTLQTRGYIARFTGECGEAREASRLFEALLPDQERVLGPDHSDTLETRGHIARSTGQCGEAREALRLYEALLPDMERVLGTDHPATLTTRETIRHGRKR